MRRDLTLRDLLFWVTMKKGYTRDDRIRAVWEQVERRVRDCVETYYKPKDDYGQNRPHTKGRV